MENVTGHIILIQETGGTQQHEVVLITLLGESDKLLLGGVALAAEYHCVTALHLQELSGT